MSIGSQAGSDRGVREVTPGAPSCQNCEPNHEIRGVRARVGAIAGEWYVTPDQLAAFGTLGAATNIIGALFSGWLSTRIGPWRTYIILGWALIAAMLCLTLAPRAATYFLAVELFYRAASTGCYAALLGIVMTAIGRGAASTKAAALWSLANLASVYPTLIRFLLQAEHALLMRGAQSTWMRRHASI